LKGIRVNDARVTAHVAGKETASVIGDVIFTDYGVSGDAVFRLSAFLVDKENAELSIDFLPDYTQEQIFMALKAKRENFPNIAVGELLCGMVNNQIARAVMKRANGDLLTTAKLVKAFTLPIIGSLGFDYAQVTKGGVRMDEVDENLQSRLVKGLYFAGEILDVDGQCGGFNLQWAYASASTVARALNGEDRGHVCV
jgi:predicted Rossmann fold flavoprotein